MGQAGRLWAATAAGLLLPAGAWAFCGTYVGGAGSEIYNQVSEVVYVRSGTRTTLTLHSDVLGDTDDFAMLIPVPEVISQDNIHTVDASAIQMLDDYSAPRRVRYTCEDFRPRDSESDADADSDADTDTDTDTDWDVDVEAEYVVGEYSVVILSSGDAGDLQGWLNLHGYVTPPDEKGILDSYIQQGTYFLAARLNEDGVLPSDSRLSPLQLSYEAEMMSLPIRIGTLSAEDTQDLIIYAMNPLEDGAAGISNYPEAQLEESCLWLPPEGDSLNDEQFAAFYLSQLDAAYAESGAFWTQEYAWAGGKCDPCEGTLDDLGALVTLGVPEEQLDSSYMDLFFTRLHMRYAPEDATQDLSLYLSRRTDTHQQRYIDYLHELESRFPICGEGYPLEPGECDFDTPSAGDDTGGEDALAASEGCGCGSDDTTAALAGVLSLSLLGWRRRRAAV